MTQPLASHGAVVKGPHPTPQDVARHVEMLEQKVFQVETKWPQFRLLLDDCLEYAQALPAGATVVALERTLLYGGISLFAPIFSRQNFISVDCSPESANNRGGYNKAMIDDPRCLAVPATLRGQPEKTGLDGGIADLVIVPNLVHHVADQQGLFAEISRLLKPNAKGYIFEPLVRELHQYPDDFIRYTPAGFQRMITAAGMIFDREKHEGGPFTAVAYCWAQALEYFPDEERLKMEDWFYKEQFPKLKQWDRDYPVNLKRKHTSFPTAFGIHFHKPA